MTYEHDGCKDCKWEHREVTEEPCRCCKGTVLPIGSTEYNTRADYYYPADKPLPTAEDFGLKINDAVDHPLHYTSGGIECIDAIEAAISSIDDPVAAFLTGQVIKYIWRWKLKNGLTDLRKANWYLQRLIKKETNNA